ncbi:MAG: class I SAM-dependent methyltransferase [Mucilaginibacter sp.]
MELVKETLNDQKLRGGYYTPDVIATFLSKWAITKDTQRVLEPSCGDGNFVEAAIRRFNEVGIEGDALKGRIKGIELVEVEAIKAKQRAKEFGLNSTTIVNSDFFQYLKASAGDSYDVVLGNPPFIRYQNFSAEHRQLAISMMEALGLSPNKLTNIWVPFLVVSASLLNANGKLGMVIPAELFQVKYAAETRIFLSKFFSRITIITFKKLVFEDIQQEIVLLLCEKDVTTDLGIRVVELNSLKELKELDLKKIQSVKPKLLEHDSEKWTKYFLDEGEIAFLRKVKADKRIKSAKEFMDVNVGLVTGRNEFFMLNEEMVEKWNLKAYTKRVVSRSNHFKGIIFNDEDFLANAEANIEGYLFLPPDEDFERLPKVCQDYITYGEEQEYHLGYKCKIRKRWYITPSLYSPDGFALRQVGDYPKIIINKTAASSTDTIHRMRLKTKVQPEIIAISFLNSLSFAFSEITGRSYGGGVLTFEPTEIVEIPLPVLENLNIDVQKIDNLIRKKRIDQVLDIIDEELLINQLHFTGEEVQAFRSIWKKLSGRRQNRK